MASCAGVLLREQEFEGWGRVPWGVWGCRTGGVLWGDPLFVCVGRMGGMGSWRGGVSLMGRVGFLGGGGRFHEGGVHRQNRIP